MTTSVRELQGIARRALHQGRELEAGSKDQREVNAQLAGLYEQALVMILNLEKPKPGAQVIEIPCPLPLQALVEFARSNGRYVHEADNGRLIFEGNAVTPPKESTHEFLIH